VLEYLATIGPADRPHGAALHYASPNTDLLGIAVERAGGAPLAELVARELWAPLGAESDAELAVDPAGTAVASGGFCATLRDYARLGQLVLEDGAGVVPSPWIAGLGAGDPDAFAARTVPELMPGSTGYGRQWWQIDGRTTACGIHGQLIAVDRRAEVVVSVLSSWPDAEDAAAQRAQRELVGAIADRLRT
jgi:hypothetical protein